VFFQEENEKKSPYKRKKALEPPLKSRFLISQTSNLILSGSQFLSKFKSKGGGAYAKFMEVSCVYITIPGHSRAGFIL
jgi:hypothetical protein